MVLSFVYVLKNKIKVLEYHQYEDVLDEFGLTIDTYIFMYRKNMLI